jgi:hypothetical protein
MSLVSLLLAAAALANGPGEAPSVCNDGGVSRYFWTQRPERHGATPMLWVRVREVRGRIVYADLEGPFARLSPDGRVRIILERFTDGCATLGPTDGPVFVLGDLVQYSSGALVLRAMPAQLPAPPQRVHGRPDVSRYDRYIVDPSYLSPEGRRRREGGK